LMTTLWHGCRESARVNALQPKAAKFDDYCASVRTRLRTIQYSLKQSDPKASLHVSRHRQYLADTFYSTLPQIDVTAPMRCAVRPIESDAFYTLKDRCEPPDICVLEPDGPRCQVDPMCVAGVIDDLLKLLPRL